MTTTVRQIIAPRGTRERADIAKRFLYDREPMGVPVPDPRVWTAIDTSGTTGVPKVVCHGKDSLVGNAKAFNAHMGFGSDLTWYHVFPLDYTAGLLNMLLCPFVAGARVVMGPEFGGTVPFHFWELPMEYGVDAMWLTPRMCETLLAVDRDARGQAYCRDHVRYICVGTDRLDDDTRERWLDRYGVPLLESYGLSEVLIVSAQKPGDETYSAGEPLPGVQVVEVDGRLVVETPYAMLGYWQGGRIGPPALPYDTGDAGRFRGGRVYVKGRVS